MNKIKTMTGALVMAIFAVSLSSCDDSFIFEKERDCSAKIQFVFKKHRQALHSRPGMEADVFESTVGSVHVFVYDTETGELVFEKTEITDNLNTASQLGLGDGNNHCYMPVDLAPGNYKIVAWCGLDENDHNNAFHLTTLETKSSYTRCDVKLSEETGFPVNDEKYEAVYHGVARNIEITSSNSNTIIPVELTKNTNDIAVWVQHTTSELKIEDYEVVYTDANGTMKFEDNALSGEDILEYHPHTKSVLTSSTQFNGADVNAGAMVAHLSTARLMESNKRDARLEVRKKDGKTIFSIPLIQYLLEMQTLTNDSQYYLDCEDTYNCSFYLSGEDGAWVPARIIINNWVRVPDQNESLGE